MKRILTPIMAAAIALPTATVSVVPAHAKVYKQWVDKKGRLRCRKSDGTLGLVVGAVGGALVGRAIDTRGDRTLGTVLGAAAGGFAGREIARRPRRCV